MSWEEIECRIESQTLSLRCSLLPPQREIDVNGKTIYTDTPSILRILKDSDRLCMEYRDRIVLIDEPEDVDDIPMLVNILKICSPKAIVFVSRFNGLRRIVVVEDLIPIYKNTTPPSIPVIHIAKPISKQLIDEDVRIYAKAIVRESIGYNVVADIHGDREGIVYVTAHHDHWFSGFTDNILGVAIAMTAAKHISKKYRVDTRFVSFTAEEGFPYPLSAFYWLVGSRNHIVKNRSILDKILFVVNYDTIMQNIEISGRGFEIYALKNLDIDIESVDHNDIIFDSYSFAQIGIPSMTIHSFSKVLSSGIYHSQLDRENVVDLDTVYKVIALTDNIFRVFRDRYSIVRLHIEKFKEKFHEKMLKDTLPLDIALDLFNLELVLNRLLDMGRVEDSFRLLRLFNRSLFKVFMDERRVFELGEREKCDFIPIPRGSTKLIDIPLGGYIDVAMIRDSLKMLNLYASSLVQAHY